MKYLRFSILCILAVVLLVSIASADVPLIINYQGRLTDTGGDPLPDTTLNITFSIYRGDGTLEWTSGPQAVQVSDGLFSYALGSNVTLPVGIISRTYSRLLGIKVGDDPEIVPRTELISAPYAYNASRSDTAYYSHDIADNIVTGPKIATDAVGSNEILNGSIRFEDIDQNGSVTGQVMKWSGSAWVASNDETGSGGGGDITAVTAGDGLTGGGTSGDVTLSVDANAITSTHIATNAVGLSEIASNAVASSEIVDGSVGWNEIANSVITEEKINTNAVTTVKIANSAVTSDKIAMNAIIKAHMATNSVGSDEIENDAVGVSEIAANAVGSLEIATNAVGSFEIATDAVGADEIDDGTVGWAEIADGVITTEKIYGGAVTDVKIASNAVTAAKIANYSITTNKIGTDAVTAVKIATNAVGPSEIATGSVYSDEIANSSIVNEDISGTAEISVNKISGTAVNFGTTQTIYGDKTFHDFHIGDSVLTADNVGIVMGTTDIPTYTNMLLLDHRWNSVSDRRGIAIDLINDGSGTTTGIHSYCYAEGHRYGVLAVANDWGADVSHNSYGIYAKGDGGAVAYGGRFIASNGTTKYGVYGTCGVSNGNFGAYFYGNVDITGGYTKAAGGFRIDHPENPANMYLSHSDVSSPEQKNVYDGVAELDPDGNAVIELPPYFESLNEKFRYQLTPLGSAMSDLHIAQEIEDNKFAIGGGKPFMKVSWQVTGIRKDAFAKAKPITVEAMKDANKQGLYQNPELFGYGIEKAVDYENHKNDEMNDDENIE